MARALRLLTGRDRTVAELQRRLRDGGFDPALVGEVLERLGSLGYLDDRRTARNWAESARRSGRWFGPRLKMELQRRGVPREIAEEVCRDQQEDGTAAAALALVCRRYPNYAAETATPAERQRIYQFLLRRGIAPAAARSALEMPASADGHWTE
jgi:regulatory protein